MSIWMAATCSLVVALFGGASLAYEKVKIRCVAGKDYRESEMAYGQYLAMFIWVPVFVEHVYVAAGKYTHCHTPGVKLEF